MFSLPGGLYSLFRDLPVGCFEIYVSVIDKQPSSAYLTDLFPPQRIVTPSDEVSPTFNLQRFQVYFQRKTLLKGTMRTADPSQVQLQNSPSGQQFPLYSCFLLSLVTQFLIHSVGGCSILYNADYYWFSISVWWRLRPFTLPIASCISHSIPSSDGCQVQEHSVPHSSHLLF